MTREEFSRVIAYITAGTNKALTADSLEVYYDLLGDLPSDVLLSAAKRVVLEHPWATFPSVAELRAAAMLSTRGDLTDISPSQAWEMARTFGERFDPDVQGEYRAYGKTYPSQFDYLTSTLPAPVVRAIRSFGALSLSVGDEPTGVLRAQFMKTFEHVVASERREALLPPSLKQAIESIGRQIPEQVKQITAGIGRPVE